MIPIESDSAPRLSSLRLFLRFLRFGLLAWGGPVAQIALIKQELVDEERWILPERFGRVLAIYQALPGPEATELCVYFGMLAGGRLGGAMAGLGFMLPGWILMTGLSWFYVSYGLTTPALGAIFLGFKPAVAALVIRGVHSIGRASLRDRVLWAIAIGSGAAQLLGVHFLPILVVAGLVYAGYRWRRGVVGGLAAGLGWSGGWIGLAAPSLLGLFAIGLRMGLLTFGGAYTAIPIMHHDAVVAGGWMSDSQFLDGLALGGILPAPLIIFSTFVGYLGGGLAGSIVMTLGVFLPAFLMTLIGHSQLERLVQAKATHALLDGVTAGVVGLIAATSFKLLGSAIPDVLSGILFVFALVLLYRWRAKAAVAVVVLGAGLIRLILG